MTNYNDLHQKLEDLLVSAGLSPAVDNSNGTSVDEWEFRNGVLRAEKDDMGDFYLTFRAGTGDASLTYEGWLSQISLREFRDLANLVKISNSGYDKDVKLGEFKEQPAPELNESTPIYQLMVQDVQQRAEYGKRTYETYLQAHNGRDALRDAYEEALDLALYLKQALVERDAEERDAEERDAGAKEIFFISDEYNGVSTFAGPYRNWFLAWEANKNKISPNAVLEIYTVSSVEAALSGGSATVTSTRYPNQPGRGLTPAEQRLEALTPIEHLLRGTFTIDVDGYIQPQKSLSLKSRVQAWQNAEYSVWESDLM